MRPPVSIYVLQYAVLKEKAGALLNEKLVSHKACSGILDFMITGEFDVYYYCGTIAVVLADLQKRSPF
jgi:hypothetical protein